MILYSERKLTQMRSARQTEYKTRQRDR